MHATLISIIITLLLPPRSVSNIIPIIVACMLHFYIINTLQVKQHFCSENSIGNNTVCSYCTCPPPDISFCSHIFLFVFVFVLIFVFVLLFSFFALIDHNLISILIFISHNIIVLSYMYIIQVCFILLCLATSIFYNLQLSVGYVAWLLCI